MTIAVRRYRPDADYGIVAEFLVEAYRPGDRLVVWLQPRWEYMFSHPNIDDIDLRAIGIAQAGDTVVGTVHPEHSMAFAYLQVHPDHPDATPRLIDWAEDHLGGWSNSLQREVLAIITDHPEAERLLQERGYQTSDLAEPHGSIDLREPPAAVAVPEGYRLQSLAEDNDHREINRVR